MSSAYHNLLNAVRELPTHERIAMIQTLLEDLKGTQTEEGVHNALVSELHVRMEAFYQGDMPIISAEEARTRLAKKIGR